MKNLLLIVSFFFLYNASAQTSFSGENILIQKWGNHSHDINEIFSSDLNGDGFKELFVVYEGIALWYKNINGDIRYNNPHILDNALIDGRSIYVADINNDNLKEIIVADRYLDKISLFQNSGDDSFSSSTVIEVNGPLSVVAEDINNDGYNDIVAALNNDNAVVYYLNDGNGAFGEQHTLFTYYNGAIKVQLFDIDNDGLKDVFSTLNNGPIQLNKNLGNGIFAEGVSIAYADSFTTFDFLDVNNDTYPDIVFTKTDKISYCLNLNGAFSNELTLLTATESSPAKIIAKDMDNDQLSDIVITRSDSSIEWFKNNGNSTFTQSGIISPDSVMSYIKTMIIEDINNDGNQEIIASSFSSNDSNMQKLSYFNYNSAANSYEEEIINRSLAAVENIRIGDINNDGLNDIVSGYANIVWNKNIGNNNFSSYYQVSNTSANTLPTAYTIELADMNNDGFLDVVATNHGRLEIYKNDGLGKFKKAYSKVLDIYSRDHKIADVNGDSIPDIVLTFISGNTRLGVITGLGDFSYAPIAPIVFTNYYYEPNKVSCGDIDNDGDIDIAVSSFEKSAVQWLENNGAGNFEMHLIATSISTDAIALADMDNNGQLDIITTASENNNGGSGVSCLKNNNGVFSPSYVDSGQILSSLTVADINQDGLKDIIGASYDYDEIDEKLICYIASGNTFEKIIVNSLGDVESLSRDVDVADLNNDNKPDIVTSHYFVGQVTYYINSSVLGTDDFETNGDICNTYPNPVNDRLNWNNFSSEYNVTIYDMMGKKIHEVVDAKSNSTDVSFLNKGIYIVKFSGGDKNYTAKIIKE
jgi:hypothetical protein